MFIVEADSRSIRRDSVDNGFGNIPLLFNVRLAVLVA